MSGNPELIGPYAVEEEIGRGGMGVVYRARDPKLDRLVAIKVLPEAFAADTERLARFEREAKVLASLNHPNIASIHGFEESGDVQALVLELVEGPTLADRLKQGPVPIEEAIAIAKQIADALEAGHEAGIVHRDLKPANIKIRDDGTVKILDYGLAKAFEGEAAAGSDVDLTQSPTLMQPTSASLGTQAGVILGTAAYMSPEQAKGARVDKRADIWAFGVVLYEMLTGTGAFRGDSVADTMASVLKLTPAFDRLPPDTPPGVERVLRRCLRKDPDRRLHDIADARIELEEVDLDEGARSPAEGETGARRPSPLALLLTGLLALLVGGALGSFLAPKALSSDPAPAPVRRSVIPLPDGRPLNLGQSIAISPDGTLLALNTGLDAEARLDLRRLDSFETEPIPGTEGAFVPFFSPDGSELAFWAGGQLRKVSLRGGGREVTALCDAPNSRGGAWDSNGWIYFLYGESRLARVRESGGAPEELGEAGDVHHVAALPEGRGILLTLQPADAPSNRKDTSVIAVLSPDATTVTAVLEGGYNARYLAGGYLVFMRAGGLFAVPFDLETLEATPPAVSVQPRVRTDSVWALAQYDVSSDGTLVYVSGGDAAWSVPTWVDVETKEEEPLPVPAGVYNNFDLSPDGTQLAIQNASGAEDQVWIYDSRRGTFTRLTLDGANIYPVWSHDGREVFFASSRDGEGFRLYRKPVDGSGPASRLLTDEAEATMETSLPLPTTVTPDGQSLLVMTWAHPTRGGDVWEVPLDGSADPRAVLATTVNEIIPQVSPDGQWLAYISDSTGDYHVKVRPYPEVERREWVVSENEGFDPRWSPDGDELLYRRGWGSFVSVPVVQQGVFEPGVGRELFEIDAHDSAGPSFAVSPDGERVLVNKPVEVSFVEATPVSLVTGWTREVERRVTAEANR